MLPFLLIAATASASGPPIDAFFAPYDISATIGSSISALQTDLALVQVVVAARKAFDRSGTSAAPSNAFSIYFCVYNLLDPSYVQPLIAAAKAGVKVQVLMDAKNLEKPYVHTYDWFRNASLKVAPTRNTTQRDLTKDERRDLNLLGIKMSGLMHMKLRAFSWLATPTAPNATRVVVSGSFNPEDGALRNEDTLLVVHDAPIIDAYMRAYVAVRDDEPYVNEYEPSSALNLLYSRGSKRPAADGEIREEIKALSATEVTDTTIMTSTSEPPLMAREVLLDLVRNETELILLSVYSLRNVADRRGTLVDALCAAVHRGVAVAVLVDKGQADGESGFAGGDSSLTALHLWKSCGVPVYKCKNYAGRVNALHHKNALFGVKKRRIVWTDTANWSSSSMGNGTSHAKPRNAETSLVIASHLLDGGRLGLRFLSNALQLVRKYAYQQACPYNGPDGMPVEAQCAKQEKWHQPNWVQPNATTVLHDLIVTAGADVWPMVEVTFTTTKHTSESPSADSHGAPTHSPTLRYRVDREAHEHEVRMEANGSGWAATVPNLPFGALVSVRVAALGLLPVTFTVDAAFDWTKSPPVRRTDAQLDSMKVAISLDTNMSRPELAAADDASAPRRLPWPPWPSKPLAARDGFGNVVDWFLVIKAPQATFPARQVDEVLQKYGSLGVSYLNISRTDHCQCADPECPASANTSAGAGRGSGLCYLYADSNNRTLRWYTDVSDPSGRVHKGLGCLGQGGQDPLSTTLRQMNGLRDKADVEWSYWNDQYEGLSDSHFGEICSYSAYSNESLPYRPCSTETESSGCGMRCGHKASAYRQCSTDGDCAAGDTCKQIQCEQRVLPHWGNVCGAPFAHAKGTLMFRKGSTGFYLQATTPNFPDPSLTAHVGTPGLGCQLVDNTKFAQSFLGMTLDSTTFRSVLGPALKAARLCSTGTNSCERGKAGHVGNWACTSEHTRGQSWSMLDDAFSGNSTAGQVSTSITVHTAAAAARAEEEAAARVIDVGAMSAGSVAAGEEGRGGGKVAGEVIGEAIHLVVKAEGDQVPPWLLVASSMGTDLAVSSWLEEGYGGPSICKGDDYSRATRKGCLVDSNVSLRLRPSGGAAFSVENALAASVSIGAHERAWGLWGDLRLAITSHAKFGVGSSSPWFVSGDMNQQGWPCSKDCDGSQLGRGGTFLGIYDAELHASVAKHLRLVCACDTASMGTLRFCNFGCFRKPRSPWEKTPGQPKQDTSPWDGVGWGKNNTVLPRGQE